VCKVLESSDEQTFYDKVVLLVSKLHLHEGTVICEDSLKMLGKTSYFLSWLYEEVIHDPNGKFCGYHFESTQPNLSLGVAQGSSRHMESLPAWHKKCFLIC